MSLEAVQYREFGKWHAVIPTDEDRTFCGKNAIKAHRMYFKWDEVSDRCANCVIAMSHWPGLVP